MKLKALQLENEETPALRDAKASDSTNTTTKGEIGMNHSIAITNTPIVNINAGQPVTTSLAVAEGVGNPHDRNQADPPEHQ